jgi:hypothetical protein
MPFPGLINGKDIANLNPDNFRAVLNSFIVVEANFSGVAPGNLELSLRNNDPDAGIDARVQWPHVNTSELILGGENALQFKAGKLVLSDLKKELAKPGVKQTIRNGGNYILCVGHDYNPTDAKKWRQKFRRLARQRRIPIKKSRILFASEIAHLVSRYPSVVVMPELGKGIPLFLTVAQWSNQPQHNLVWKPDAARTETIGRIRMYTHGTDPGEVFRIEGSAGVGKTRVALEGVKEIGVAEATVYAPNSEDSQLIDLLSFLVGNHQARAVIVADECSIERQNVLKSYAEACGGRIKIICVGTPDLLTARLLASANLVLLEVLSDEQIRAILSQILQSIPQEVIDTAVRVAKGFVKLAIFVVQELIKQRDLDLLELSKIGNVGDFLRRFVKPEIRDVLQAFSLLARVGWKEDLGVEATTIARYLDIPMRDMKKGVVALRNQGVLMEQGRYMYVTPDLLAIFAAAQLWEEEGSDLIQIIEKLPGRDSRLQLLRRLAAMGHHPHIRSAVETLLGPAGLYQQLGDLNEEFRSEMFRILSAALPNAATEVLERIISNAGLKELLDFKRGRRNVMWATESLLRWPSTSLSAARVLRALALAENESIGNNATGIFCQYFQMYLSGCPLPLTDRLEIIDELVSLGTPEARTLAVKALGSGLLHHEFRMGGNVDDLSGQPYPEDWRPKVWGDLWDSRRQVLARLRQIAEAQDDAAEKAQETLMGSPFTLIRDGMWADAISILDETVPSTDSQRLAILDGVKRIEREVGEKLSESEKAKLKTISERTFDSSLSGRLHRWIGHRTHADYDLEGKTGFATADAEVVRLADEAYLIGLKDDDLEWLASPQAEHVWGFGQRLGELDEKSKYFPRLVISSKKDMNCLLLASYLSGQASAKGQAFREAILDELANIQPELAFACTWRGTPSSHGLERILRLVDSGAVQPESLGYLAYGSWTHSFSSKEVEELLERMLRAAKPKIMDPAMGIVLALLKRDPGSFEQVEASVWKMIRIKPDRNWSWEWGMISSTLAKRDPKRLTTIVLSFFEEEGFLAPPDGYEKQALSEATKQSPEECWDAIGQFLLRMDSASHRLLLGLREWYGELLPTPVLIQWAKDHLPKGPGIAAELVAVKANVLPERARALLINFPDDKYVLNIIVGHLMSGSWTGPRSGRLRYEIEIAQGWTKDPDPKLREFAQGLVKGLKKTLERQLVMEEEGRFA